MNSMPSPAATNTPDQKQIQKGAGHDAATDLAVHPTRVLQSPSRTPLDRTRDQMRAPLQILKFLDIKPDHRVLDFSSWDGYWSTLFTTQTKLPIWCQNMIAWRLSAESKVQMRLALPDKTQNPNGTNPNGPLRFFFSDFGNPTPPVPPMCSDPSCPGCTQPWGGWENMFDHIFTYVNYHDAEAELGGKADVNSFNQWCYRLLRPGGHLVVIDHAAIDGSQCTYAKDLHRIDETWVVNEITSAGFEFVEADNTLRYPADQRNTPAWIQDQPPILTDRFALKFRKPGGEEQEREALMCYLGHW
ncbi:hypothetical protein HK101_003571 [Irineochytrium annulatum]|nr:hypothetical protein HK101_003571 [Irineochytrium annulatum]